MKQNIRLMVDPESKNILGQAFIKSNLLLCALHSIHTNTKTLKLQIFSAGENIYANKESILVKDIIKIKELDTAIGVFSTNNNKIRPPIPTVDFTQNWPIKGILISLFTDANGRINLQKKHCPFIKEMVIQSETMPKTDKTSEGIFGLYEGWLFKAMSGSILIDEHHNMAGFAIGNYLNKPNSFIVSKLFNQYVIEQNIQVIAIK